MFDYNGPMVWMANMTYDSTIAADSIIKQFDIAVAEIEKKVTPEDLKLAIVKGRSAIYDAMGQLYGIGKLNLLAAFALFDDNPAKINNIENEFKKVTVDLIKKTAREYLRPSNRTILIIDPKAAKK
jgi:predicted Zn-dependent peptidase